jgi:hypothetical protein
VEDHRRGIDLGIHTRLDLVQDGSGCRMQKRHRQHGSAHFPNVHHRRRIVDAAQEVLDLLGVLRRILRRAVWWRNGAQRRCPIHYPHELDLRELLLAEMLELLVKL